MYSAVLRIMRIPYSFHQESQMTMNEMSLRCCETEYWPLESSLCTMTPSTVDVTDSDVIMLDEQCYIITDLSA